MTLSGRPAAGTPDTAVPAVPTGTPGLGPAPGEERAAPYGAD
ncbi:hypothetical protein [Streptomyces argyrophylli]|nr:hypothetical protein [Streptomyces argyrophyllae]